MDAVTVKELMAEQLATVRKSELRSVFGWEITENDLCAYVTLRPRQCRDRDFFLRILFDDFPRQAPSYVFVDVTTREMTDEAWPPGVRHIAAPPAKPPPGICTPGTREFHEHYHAKDAKYAWESKPNVVLATLAEIHRMMERGIPRK